MARRCELTGKGVQAGHHVSHANNKRKRVFRPNLQVITLAIFLVLFVDYVIRFVRKSANGPLKPRMKLFLGFLFLSIVFVLIRCSYRIEELSDGYDGPLIRNEGLFMGLEAA